MTQKIRVLLVEDEIGQVDQIREDLRGAGEDIPGYEYAFEVDAALTLGVAWGLFKERPYDLVITDVNLTPEQRREGFQLCERIRNYSERSHTPIIMLSTFGALDYKAEGFTAGADEYLDKTGVNMKALEQLHRIRAVLRRSYRPKVAERSNVVEAGPFKLDRAAHQVVVDGVAVQLTDTQTAILAHLMERPDTIIKAEDLQRDALGLEVDADTSGAIRFHVLKLRRAIEPNPSEPRYLVTVRRSGYKLQVS